jgi:hypothetical protein
MRNWYFINPDSGTAGGAGIAPDIPALLRFY